MNSNLLKKCIDELKKENPNIDYLRGILETLYEMQIPAQPDKAITTTAAVLAGGSMPKAPVEIRTEADVLEAEARERLKGIKDIAD